MEKGDGAVSTRPSVPNLTDAFDNPAWAFCVLAIAGDAFAGAAF